MAEQQTQKRSRAERAVEESSSQSSVHRLFPCVIAGIAIAASVWIVPLRAGQAEWKQDLNTDWKLMRDEHGIRSFRALVPGSPRFAFKAEAVVDRGIERVLSVVLDDDRMGEWVPRVTESRRLRWIDEPCEFLQLARFDAPWPVSDRVFLSRIVLSVNARTRRTELRYFDVDKAVSTGTAIQGFAGGSYYIFEPLIGGRQTRLTAVAVVDPRGFIPSWLINWIG